MPAGGEMGCASGAHPYKTKCQPPAKTRLRNLEGAMSKGIRNSCKSLFILTLAAMGAAMLVDSSLAAPRQKGPATKPARSGRAPQGRLTSSA
jgi:hypothetical protein